jgi:sporulation protein YlmC with PRC-barrel domain
MLLIGACVLDLLTVFGGSPIGSWNILTAFEFRRHVLEPRRQHMRKFLLAAAAVSAISSATALAQNASPNNAGNGTAGVDDKMNSSGSQGGAMGANPTPAAPATTPQTAAQDVPKEGPNFIQVENTNMLSSNVVGLDIYNGQNDKIGKIQDIAFDPSKQLTGYILSVGGFLGMGTRYVAVNPSALNVSYDSQNKVWRASMNATKDQLKSAPEFKYGGQWTASRS